MRWVSRAAWNVSASGWTPDDSPTVSVDRQGDALPAWNACDLSTPGCSSIGADRGGRFVVAWARGSDVVARRITSTSVSSTKVLTSPIAAYGGFGTVRLGVDRDGDAVITHHSGGGARAQVWASRWTRYNSGGALELLGRRLSATGARGAVTSLGLGDRPALALDDDGDGMLVFHTVVPKSTPPYSHTRSSARLISRSGAFGTTKTLTSDGRVPRVGTRPTARFTVVWQQESFPYTIKSVTGP
ncbi:hypothetical protein ACWCPX_01990 [Streptomyces olivaceoviridis]